MVTDKEINERAEYILGIIAPKAAMFNDVLDPLIDMLKRHDSPDLSEVRAEIAKDPALAKLDILRDAIEAIAEAEAMTGGRYKDEQLAGKLHADLKAFAMDLATVERHRSGGLSH